MGGEGNIAGSFRVSLVTDYGCISRVKDVKEEVVFNSARCNIIIIWRHDACLIWEIGNCCHIAGSAETSQVHNSENLQSKIQIYFFLILSL